MSTTAPLVRQPDNCQVRGCPGLIPGSRSGDGAMTRGGAGRLKRAPASPGGDLCVSLRSRFAAESCAGSRVAFRFRCMRPGKPWRDWREPLNSAFPEACNASEAEWKAIRDPAQQVAKRCSFFFRQKSSFGRGAPAGQCPSPELRPDRGRMLADGRDRAEIGRARRRTPCRAPGCAPGRRRLDRDGPVLRMPREVLQRADPPVAMRAASSRRTISLARRGAERRA